MNTASKLKSRNAHPTMPMPQWPTCLQWNQIAKSNCVQINKKNIKSITMRLTLGVVGDRDRELHTRLETGIESTRSTGGGVSGEVRARRREGRLGHGVREAGTTKGENSQKSSPYNELDSTYLGKKKVTTVPFGAVTFAGLNMKASAPVESCATSIYGKKRN